MIFGLRRSSSTLTIPDSNLANWRGADFDCEVRFNAGGLLLKRLHFSSYSNHLESIFAAVRSNNPTVYMIFLFIVTHLMKVITDGFSVTIRSHDDISGDVPLIYRRLRAFSNFLGICVLKFSIYIESWHESYMPIIVIRVIAWTQIENGTSNETKISLLSLISTLGRQGVWILQWHLFEHLRNVSPSHKCMSCNIFYAAWCWM